MVTDAFAVERVDCKQTRLVALDVREKSLGVMVRTLGPEFSTRYLTLCPLLPPELTPAISDLLVLKDIFYRRITDKMVTNGRFLYATQLRTIKGVFGCTCR